MVDVHTEPETGLCITLGRIFDHESQAPSIPFGELVFINGAALDECEHLVMWSVTWRGNAYWCLPAELRPASDEEVFRQSILAFPSAQR